MIAQWTYIDWDKFHFLRPEYLWLFLPIGLILILGVLSFRDEERWKQHIASHLRPYVIQKGSNQMRLWIHIFLMFFLSVAVLGLSGPTWSEIKVPGKILETPVVIVLDLSQSMMASDIQPNRLDRAKFKIKDLLDANPRSRMALVGFAGTAHTIIPLSRDYRIINSHLDGLDPHIMPYQGTNFEMMFDVVDTIVAITDAPSRLILFTDEISEELFQSVQKYIQTEGRNVVIVPMITTPGAEIPRPGSTASMRDKNGEVVRSALDQDMVLKLGALSQVEISQLTLDKSDMEKLAKEISTNLNFQEKEGLKEDDWEDQGWVLIIPLLLLTLVWFRKGFVIYTLLFVMTLQSCDSDTRFSDFWYTNDYQGQRLFDAGDYDSAAVVFEDPMRKGVAYYKAGNFEAAIQAFGKDTTSNGMYNLGLAYYQNGNIEEAQMAFGMAVELDPNMEAARVNQKMLDDVLRGQDEVNPEDATESHPLDNSKNIENKDMEDLGGGGQEATKEDMQRERKEETVSTDIRKGKELDEVPDDIDFGNSQRMNPQKVLMRKVDDDPALFLKRKFKYQAKKKGLKPKKGAKKW